MKRAWAGFLLFMICCLGAYIRKSYLDIQNEYQPMKPPPIVKTNPWKAGAKTPRRLRPVLPPEPPCEPWLDWCAARQVKLT